MDDEPGDFLPPPYGTTPAAVKLKAEKGGSVIIMDTEHYKDVNILLMDKSYLQTKRYLTRFENKGSQFCGLLKFHKSKQISENVKVRSSYVEIKYVNDIKLKPIVAGSSVSDTENKQPLRHIA